FLGAWQVAHLADFPQEVELARPVVADHERGHPVFPDVIQLLFPGALRDDQVDVADGLQHDLAVLVVEQRRLVLGAVELVRGQADDQAVSERACAPEQVDVADVEDVEGPVGDDGARHVGGPPFHYQRSGRCARVPASRSYSARASPTGMNRILSCGPIAFAPAVSKARVAVPWRRSTALRDSCNACSLSIAAKRQWRVHQPPRIATSPSLTT